MKPSLKGVDWFLPLVGISIAVLISYMVGHLVGLMETCAPSTHEQEVFAQKLSAWAGLASAISSFLAFVAAAAGLIWIKGTLDAARSSARTAQDAIAEATKIGQAQVKAYISLEHERVCEWEDTGILRVNAKIKNSGQSPARNLICFVTWQEPMYPAGAVESMKPLGDLSASSEQIKIDFPLTIHSMPLDGQMTMVLKVVCQFTDVFGERIEEKFVYAVAGGARSQSFMCMPYLH